LLGDQLAALAQANGWSGIVVNGCIRDAREIAKLDLGVRALNTHPRKSRKLGQGEVGVSVNFAGVSIAPGNVVYADEDGILIARTALEL
jgi:regulator of ribonuclease activity A